MIYPHNFEEKTGFTKIRDWIKESCLFELGAKRASEMSFMSTKSELLEELSRVHEMTQIVLYEDKFPVQYYFNVLPALTKIKTEGAYLEVNEMFDFKRSYEAINTVLLFFKNKEGNSYPYLQKTGRDVKIYPFILERLNKVLNRNGEVRDNASKELLKLRRSIDEKKKNVNGKIQSILKKAKNDDVVEQDVMLAIRDGRVVIPVASMNKRMIRGFIHDESSTGKTVYIEPAEIVELNNEIKELEYAERREIIKILIVFANDSRPYYDDIINAYDYLGTIDFIRAKAKLSIRLNAQLPGLTDKPKVNWKEAVHPLLYVSHSKEKKSVVPLDIMLDEINRILLISGPNAGGKSVCLQTVGLLQYMLQCGVLVPASEASEFGLFDSIFIDIGDEQSIENDLSTYSSHLVNMKYFVKNCDERTLLLIDEFGTGTEPMLGGAIAESILGVLLRKKVYGVITTHYTNLKHFASSVEGIQNGAMLFDAHRMEPLFILEAGKPGSSFAFEIARKIGLPEEILQSATQKVGEDHIQFDKHLKDIIRDKRYWENKRQRIRKSEKKLEEVLGEYSEELQDAQKLKKEILEQAKKEAKELLSDVNKQIEKTIREIKESNAEKERTKAARKELEAIKQNVCMEDDQKQGHLERKIKNLGKRQQRYKKMDGELSGESSPLEESINVGDIVKLVGQDIFGEVLEVNGKSIMVAFGNMITTLDEKKLIKTEHIIKNFAGKKAGSFSSQKSWNIRERKLIFKPDIDVRGQRAEEAVQTIMDFIDEAIVVNATQLRILHGKGNGVLRQIIREYLHTVDVVKSCKDEHVERGGAGITVVELEM